MDLQDKSVATDFSLTQKYFFISGLSSTQFSLIQEKWLALQPTFGTSLKAAIDFSTEPKKHLLNAFKESIKESKAAHEQLETLHTMMKMFSNSRTNRSSASTASQPTDPRLNQSQSKRYTP